MKDPASAMSNYQAGLITESAPYVMQVTQHIQTQYASLQKQHGEFVAHVQSQVYS